MAKDVEPTVGVTGAADDDRSTRARIRDAAILVWGQHGPATTARKVAEAAGVSAGSVMHHFESMDGLRVACDEHVVKLIREQNAASVADGGKRDPFAAIDDVKVLGLGSYLAAVLVEGSPAVDKLVDEMIRDAVDYLEDGVATGSVKPSDRPEARAALMMIWSLGSLVLHRHFARAFGFDMISSEPADRSAFALYGNAAMDVLGDGLLTPSYVREMRRQFDRAEGGE